MKTRNKMKLMDYRWQNTNSGMQDCLENMDEDDSKLSDEEVRAKYVLFKSIIDNYHEIRYEFDFITEENEKRSSIPIGETK